jgi:indole-3-glycerol phosphate synthase
MSVLAEICREKLDYVQRMQHLIPDVVMIERARLQAPPRGFIKAIKAKKLEGIPSLIAEVKKASPSKGIIRSDFDPQKIARIYEASGATCMSVLTDQPYFKGSDEDFQAARNVTRIPVIRKDFMLTPFQILESRALGADCVLLIMAALDDETAGLLFSLASSLGMDVLIEIHDKEELDRALKLSPSMIGVNSRSLKTLNVDLDTAFGLLDYIPADIIRVAESGIGGHKDLSDLHKAGYDAFLVGESLMRQNDIGLAVKKLLGNTPESA